VILHQLDDGKLAECGEIWEGLRFTVGSEPMQVVFDFSSTLVQDFLVASAFLTFTDFEYLVVQPWANEVKICVKVRISDNTKSCSMLRDLIV
jgi:hypothetical protein